MLKPGGFLFVVLLGFIFASGSLGTDLLAPAQPDIAQALRADVFSVQLIMSGFFVGHAIAQLFLGPISDRFGRKPVLRCGLWLFALSTFACALTSSIEALIGLRIIQGLGASAGTVVARAIARDHFEGRELGRVMSYMTLTLSLSPVLLPPLGGLLSSSFGWQANFLMLAMLATAVALSTEMGMKESLQQLNFRALRPRDLVSSFNRIVRHPTFVGFMVTGSLCFAGIFAFVSNSSFVFKDHFGMPMTEYGIILGLTFAGHSIGAYLGGRLVGTLGIVKLVTIGSVICCLSGLSLLIAGLLGFESVLSISLAMLLYLFGSGIVFPQSLAGALQPFPQMAGTASALMGFAVWVMASFTTAVVGAFYGGTPVVMTFVIALLGTSTLVFFAGFARLRVIDAVQTS